MWLRLGVTLVPIVFIVISLIIQHKKFIITEDYYDMMLVEIDKRRKANGDTLIGDEPADGTTENDVAQSEDAE